MQCMQNQLLQVIPFGIGLFESDGNGPSVVYIRPDWTVFCLGLTTVVSPWFL